MAMTFARSLGFGERYAAPMQNRVAPDSFADARA